MSANGNYIWRCAKCSNHLATIIKMDGVIQLEKKCSKCKSINMATFINGEIAIKCKMSSNPGINSINIMDDY